MHSASNIVKNTMKSEIRERLSRQDEALARVEKKLDAPVLNGGFEKLTAKVEKIEQTTEDLGKQMHDADTKLSEVHTALFDKDQGIYGAVTKHTSWIEGANSYLKKLSFLMLTGIGGLVAKAIWDVLKAAH
jgi:chromosome segregation ATPase